MVGTTESSDAMITVMPNAGKGIEIELISDVEVMFGKSIRQTIAEVLKDFEVVDARVEILDKGALDCTLRARMQCAICRAAEIQYDWRKERLDG